jgi:protein TonB
MAAMTQNSAVRLGIGIPIAAIVTVGLFLLMNFLIRVDEVQLTNVNTRTLSNLTPESVEQNTRTMTRTKAAKMDVADKPPPPPVLTASKSNINLPTPKIEGSAPSRIDVDRVNAIDVGAVVVDDRDAQPIRPPIPQYPRRAAERGIEGRCDVRFDVNPQGRPYNVAATCTDSVFEDEAIRAVSRAEFAPKIVRGKAAERRNVVYPLVFKLQ